MSGATQAAFKIETSKEITKEDLTSENLLKELDIRSMINKITTEAIATRVVVIEK